MTARPILSREVLARMTDHVVTVYLVDGNHLTGRLSSVIVSGHRDDRDAAQGLHLVDLADGTPHDVAYVYLPHVVAIAPARDTTSARGDEPPRPSSQTRHLELDAGTSSARFVVDHDVRVAIDRPVLDSGRPDVAPKVGPTLGLSISWTSEGKLCTIDADADGRPIDVRYRFGDEETTS